jgi:hypothetical protein
MTERETFDQLVDYLKEQGYHLAGWGGTSLKEGKISRVLQISETGILKNSKKIWGTLWLERSAEDKWMIYCWLRKKADKLKELAGKLEHKFNRKIEFHILYGHDE